MRHDKDVSILITNKDFQRILSGWLTFSDKKRNKVCEDYGLTVDDVDILRKLWLGLDFNFPEQPSAKIENALDETLWKIARRQYSINGKSKIRKIYERFSRIAAILIIPVILYTVYVQFFDNNSSVKEVESHLITVNSQPGTTTNVVLPDGTKVYLNSGSSISYPDNFSGDMREVSMSGEAYFEVVKNKKVPMLVAAHDLNIKVYGTSFNVNAYSDEEFARITLVEGSISLSSPLGKFKGEKEFFVDPGQTVTFYDESKKLLVENDDTFLFTAWKDGILVFRNTTFGSIMKQLSRKFNVDIVLKDLSLASVPIDAKFRDESVGEILKLLALSTPFRYYYEAPQKLDDGTYAKRKIYIEEKKIK